jgi:succinate-acetate transporter protein
MSEDLGTKLANPAPLGLLGFGLTTVLLNLHNAGLFGLNSMILAMGLAYGGLAQVIVGIMEYKKGNTFGTTAFTSYGLFWWSLVGLIVLPGISVFGTILKADSAAMAAYFFMWGVFTFAMFFGTLKANRALQFVFMSLAILFFMLTIREITSNPVLFGTVTFNTITGIEGVICGLSAVYLAIAEILNEAHRKTILPICPVRQK